MNLLPTDVIYKIFLDLPLDDIQRSSCVSKSFSRLLNSEDFWNHYLPRIVPSNASFHFLEKYGSQLSMKQLVVANFNHDPKKIELIKNTKDEKRNILYKLIFSIRSLEKFTQQEEWKQYGAQRSYSHMFFCWGDHEFAFQMEMMRKSVLAHDEGKQAWQTEIKSAFRSQTDTLLSKYDDYSSCCTLFSQCQFYFQIESSEELTTFFTNLWENYAPSALDPLPGLDRIGKMFTFMPIESFTGFCNSVSQKKEFGSFEFWYLTDTHLSVFNCAFKECTVDSLNICLLPDVKKETLEPFIEMVKKKNRFLNVRVEFMKPLSVASKNLFNDFDVQQFAHVKRWMLFEG